MSSFESNSSSTVNKELARKIRLNGFNADAWLRSVNHGKDDSRELTESTITCSPTKGDFVFEPPSQASPKVDNFVTEQEYSGVVLSVDMSSKTFWARLTDRTMGLPQEDAEFSFKEVPSDDWSFIVPSAFFSWNIGCEWRDRQMRRVADFRFRRYSQFSKAAVDRAVERADALASLINDSMAYPAS